MPYTIQKDGNRYCVHKENEDGTVGERVNCHPNEAQAKAQVRALYANVEDAAAKYFAMVGVKAVGDWEIDILAVPFGVRDSDGQYFDAETDIMQGNFANPAILYHHGVMPGKTGLQDRPAVIGKALSVEKKADGWHIRALLDKAHEFARRVWDAAQKGIAVASSDSIAHLARLDIGSKQIMYEKNRPGRISVWPLAGVSLWDKVEGNFLPAFPYKNVMPLPAMKAIYGEAELSFPEITDTTNGASQADEQARKRAKVIERAKQIIEKAERLRSYQS